MMKIVFCQLCPYCDDKAHEVFAVFPSTPANLKLRHNPLLGGNVSCQWENTDVEPPGVKVW